MLNLSVQMSPATTQKQDSLGCRRVLQGSWPWGQQWTKRKKEFQGCAKAWSWNLALCGCCACAGHLQNGRSGDSWRGDKIFLLFWDMCIFITFCLGDSICWFGLTVKYWCFRTCGDTHVEMSLRKQAMQNKCVCGVYMEDKMVGICFASRCGWLTLAGHQSHSISSPSELQRGENL